MSTAEELAFSIQTEGHGVHCLLWDDKDDLVRALLILNAAMGNIKVWSFLVSTDESISRLKKVINERPAPEEHDSPDVGHGPSPFWILFLQQAVTQRMGPWLNGWRDPLARAPGTLLVVRHADFDAFQRSAPDLASFIGPKIYNASTMLSIWSSTVSNEIRPDLPSDQESILDQLPGPPPLRDDLVKWIAANTDVAD